MERLFSATPSPSILTIALIEQGAVFKTLRDKILACSHLVSFCKIDQFNWLKLFNLEKIFFYFYWFRYEWNIYCYFQWKNQNLAENFPFSYFSMNMYRLDGVEELENLPYSCNHTFKICEFYGAEKLISSSKLCFSWLYFDSRQNFHINQHI